MRLSLSQRFTGSPEAVLAVLTDRAFVDRLGELPRIDEPEVLEHRVDGDVFRQRLRYRFVGHLPGAVTAVLDPRRLVWVVDTTFDLSLATATFRIVPDHYAERLRCSGAHAITASPGGSTRTVTGDLTVRYPLVGGTVERAIASGLGEHLDDEAALVDRFLAA